MFGMGRFGCLDQDHDLLLDLLMGRDLGGKVSGEFDGFHWRVTVVLNLKTQMCDEVETNCLYSRLETRSWQVAKCYVLNPLERTD